MTTVFRKEIKYVIYQHEFAKMRPLLSALMQQDTHGGDFGYVVRSLYFDSVYDRDYYDTVDGRMKKAKIRLRIYGKDSPIKLELKQKENSDSLKQSLFLTQEEARCMQQCDYEFLSRRTEPVARTLYMRLLQGAYQPKTLVEYDREAYLYDAGDVRVTFDTGMRATASDWDLFAETPPWTTLVPHGTGVLEIKYTSLLPSFLKQIVQTDRLATANSKYIQARQFYQFGGER
jgi:hypothetical protein